jgi:Flp pilus assembly protein TadB
MNIKTMLFLISLFAGAIAFIVAVLAAGGRSAFVRTKAGRALSDSQKPARQEAAPEDAPDARSLQGLAKTLAEAGLRFTPAQFALVAAALGGLGVLLGWIFFIPGLPAVALGTALAYAPFFYARDRAQTRGQRMDKELPVTLARISVGLQTGTALKTIFGDAARHLPPDNPLAGELTRTSQEMFSVGEEAALGKLADRSPSISLSNAALMLQSFARAGGSQFAEAVSQAAVNIQRMIEVRNTAQARAAQSMQAAAIVPLILAFVLVTMAGDPAISASFREPIVQVIIVLVMAVMGFGYLFMRGQVRKVV